MYLDHEVSFTNQTQASAWALRAPKHSVIPFVPHLLSSWYSSWNIWPHTSCGNNFEWNAFLLRPGTLINPLSWVTSVVSSSNAPPQPSGPRTQPVNKRKRKVTLEVFEKQETQNTANNQRGSTSTEPSDSRRSRSPERSERRNEKDKSGRREDRTPLGPVSRNSLGSRPIRERRKTIKGKEAEEDEDMLDDIFTDAPTQW